MIISGIHHFTAQMNISQVSTLQIVTKHHMEPCLLLTFSSELLAWHLGQKPKVLLPPSADQVSADAFALLPDCQRQAIGLVDALLHKILAAAAQQATIDLVGVHKQNRTKLDQEHNHQLNWIFWRSGK